MGRASRWIRNLLGGKKATEDPPAKQKKAWGFGKTFQKERPPPPPSELVSGDARAAASTALLTAGRMKTEKRAAVKIQSAFRGYLARKALRALKGLVKVQALVRGNIVRKQAAETLRCMKALVRAQTRARAFRALHSDSAPSKSSRSYPCPATPENYEPISSKWIEDEPSWNMRKAWKSMDCERNAKILEVDSEKSRLYSTRGRSLGHLQSDRSPGSMTAGPDSLSKCSTTSTQPSTPSASPFDRRRHMDPPPRFTAADSRFCSPSSQSGSSRRGPFTPAKSRYSPNSINGCSNHPSYMAKTESSAAKSRSQSAPRQRRECGKAASTRRLPDHELGDRASRYSIPKGKAYPGSGRLDRLGMPMGYVID